jgi:hypothetical protein
MPQYIKHNLPCGHVPNSNITVTASTDKRVFPRYHCPYAHHVAGQGLLVAAISIKNMNLCVIEGNDNVFVSQMETCDDAMVRGDLAMLNSSALFPGTVNLIALFEV